jgi:hypothetical protein
MKRRAAIELGIGNLKREHRMDRNRLCGVVGDQLNAIRRTLGMKKHFKAPVQQMTAYRFPYLFFQFKSHSAESKNIQVLNF